MSSSRPAPLSAEATFDREFLPTRAKLLEVAAALDRIDRAGGPAGAAPQTARADQLRRAIETLLTSRSPDRTEQLQQIFSLPYDDSWREKFGV